MTYICLEYLLHDIEAGEAPRGCYGIEVVKWLKSKQVDIQQIPYMSITYPKDSMPVLLRNMED